MTALPPLYGSGPGVLPTIGFLSPGFSVDQAQDLAQFRSQMLTRGYTENTHFKIEARASGGDDNKWPDMAEALVDHDVDIIVATSTLSALAAKAATKLQPDPDERIPIVVALSGDLERTEIIPDMKHPKENVTGATDHHPHQASGQVTKLMDFFAHNKLGTLSTLGVLYNIGNRGSYLDRDEMEKAAKAAGIKKVYRIKVSSPKDFDTALGDAVTHEGVQAVVVLGDPLTVHFRGDIVKAAEDPHRQLPTIFGSPETVTVSADGLMAYGPSHNALFKGAADLAVEILQQPADQRLKHIHDHMPAKDAPGLNFVVNTAAASRLGPSPGYSFPPAWLTDPTIGKVP